jgi:ribulose-5-phosphate 4-epimerase/fuculose-1-phosphate aldolase
MSGAVRAFGGAADAARWQARVDLAAAYRLAHRFGYSEGICNHLTLMLPGSDDQFLLIPYGMHWSEVTASTLIAVDFDGNVTEGDGIAEDTAFFIHARLHKNAPDAACVLHTHQPYATALTMVEGGRLLPVIQSAVRFYGRIAYDDEYEGLALDNAEGDRMAACLGDKEVMFLANHGVICTGPSVAWCFDALYYLERAAQAQVLAMSTGKPLKVLSDNMARATNEVMMRGVAASAERHFESLKRLLDRDEPDYKT